MMTAEQYRERADRDSKRADTATNYAAILEWTETAREWQKLAETANWQDELLARLASEDLVIGNLGSGDPDIERPALKL